MNRIRVRRPRPESKHEQDKFLTPKGLREVLEELIANVESREVEDIEVDEDAFYRGTLTYSLIEKGRDRQQKMSIISEKQSSFTNPYEDQETTFTIRSLYEEASSLEVVTENRHSIIIGGDLSGGIVGKAGIGAKYGVERSNRKSKGERQTEGKELTLSGCVRPAHRVTVREITYDLQSRAHGKLDIIVSRKMKVKYKCEGRWFKHRSVKMKTLVKRLPPKMKAFDCSCSGVITIHMESDWVYNSVTRNLEFSSEELPDDHTDLPSTTRPQSTYLDLNLPANKT